MVSDIEFLDDDTIVKVKTAALSLGLFKLNVYQEGITDRAGNFSGGEVFSSVFTVVEANVLLLVDVDGPGVDALEEALQAAGIVVTRRAAPEYTWDGTNPGLDDFKLVIHLNGGTYSTPLPISAQQSLEEFVNEGGGFIASQ